MAIINWLWKIAAQLGLLSNIPKILFLGLPNTGKTTLLYTLKKGAIATLEPSFYPPSDEIAIGDVKIAAYELGGFRDRQSMYGFTYCRNHRRFLLKARVLWHEYFPELDGIVFLVDSADVERFADSKAELDAVLSKKQYSKVPLLVLGNKIDVPWAVSEEELRYNLGLHQTTGKGEVPLSGIRPVEVFMCSVLQRQGYLEGFLWISQYI